MSSNYVITYVCKQYYILRNTYILGFHVNFRRIGPIKSSDQPHDSNLKGVIE